MPPKERAELSQEALRLVDLLAHYFDQLEKYSEQIRSLPNGEALYNSANSQWMEDPFITPLVGDATQKTAYFARCDAIIQSTPVTMEDRFKIIFTCWAAAQVIIDQDLPKLSETEHGEVLGEMGRLVVLEAQKRNPQLELCSEDSEDEDDDDENLLGTTIRYRNHKDNTVRECTVVDYGTSHLKGEWFRIAHGNDNEAEITAREMKSMLASRV